MSRWTHVTTIALLIACPAAAGEMSQRPVQWKKADGGNGHWYQAVFVPERVNWIEAQLRATANWHQMMREWVYADPPSTVLGAAEWRYFESRGTSQTPGLANRETA